MDWIVPTIALGAATATATTFDDNIYLTIFFSKTNSTFRPRHVVVGEFVGFTALVTISLVGFFAGLMIPHIWIGLLGLLPIAIGVNALLSRQTMAEDNSISVTVANPVHLHYRQVRRTSLWHTLRDPQTYKVSAVTLANGGNNIAIYIPHVCQQHPAAPQHYFGDVLWGGWAVAVSVIPPQSPAHDGGHHEPLRAPRLSLRADLAGLVDRARKRQLPTALCPRPWAVGWHRKFCTALCGGPLPERQRCLL